MCASCVYMLLSVAFKVCVSGAFYDLAGIALATGRTAPVSDFNNNPNADYYNNKKNDP